MRTKKDKFIDILVSFAIGGWFFFVVTIFNIGKDKPPLIHAQIPPETIEFFKNLPDYIDLGFRFNENPDPDDWSKYYDGEMLSISDSCFIVYYSAIDSIEEYSKAALTLSLANEAIGHSLSIMETYPYPYTVNNRKLPIYITNTKANYIGVQDEL